MEKEKSFQWPSGYRSAISLTFDDGLLSQLKTAVPSLEKYGLRGTFYLNPRGDDWRDHFSPWIEVARTGHEVGNHSLSHLCSCNFSGDPNSRGLENASLEEIELDILEAQQRLEKLISRQKHWTYAYPCYEDFVGRGPTRRCYVPIIARYFIAARGALAGVLTANSPLGCDLHYLWSWPVERMNGAQMIGLAERDTMQGRWGILTFHGVNEGHLPVSDFDLEELLAFLNRNQDRIWTAPVADVAEYIAEWRAKNLATKT